VCVCVCVCLCVTVFVYVNPYLGHLSGQQGWVVFLECVYVHILYAVCLFLPFLCPLSLVPGRGRTASPIPNDLLTVTARPSISCTPLFLTSS